MGKNCFVIMPFSQTNEKHTKIYWDNFFYKFIKPSVEQLGYSCRRSTAQPSSIIKEILKELYETDIVIAVLTDFNANVWYELGTRHSLRKGTIMIIEDGQKIPFDILSYGLITYEDTIAGSADFLTFLIQFISKIENEKPADSPAMEFLGNFASNDFQKRVDDLEERYQRKLDKIVDLLTNIQKTDGVRVSEHVKVEMSKPKRILWVDDYPSNNEAIIDLLKHQGIEFDLAINTDQSLDLLSKNEYCAIISDMGRGNESDAGLRMIREMKRKFTNPPPILIFSSGKAVDAFGHSATKEGAVIATSNGSLLINTITKILKL